MQSHQSSHLDSRTAKPKQDLIRAKGKWAEADKWPGQWSGRRLEHISTNPPVLGTGGVKCSVSLGQNLLSVGLSLVAGETCQEKECPELGRRRRKTFTVRRWVQAWASAAEDFAVQQKGKIFAFRIHSFVIQHTLCGIRKSQALSVLGSAGDRPVS